jgi:hypothetical protein
MAVNLWYAIAMARKYRLGIAGWLFVAVLASIVTGVLVRREMTRLEVRRLVYEAAPYHRQFPDHTKPLFQLREMGDAAFLFLGEMLVAKEIPTNTWYYAKVRPRLPKFILRRLGEPYPASHARHDAAEVIENLGPAAARGTVSELCRALPVAGPLTDTIVFNSILWSVPESRRAAQVVFDELATHGVMSRPIRWPIADLLRKLPALAPFIANQRGALGLLRETGTNAVPLIPLLRSIALNGPVQDNKPGPPYSASALADVGARIEAIDILGRVGRGDASVASALLGLSAGTNQDIRLAAVFALAQLDACPKGLLLAALTNAVFSPRHSPAWPIYQLGQIGPSASEALPWIERFAESESGAPVSTPADHSAAAAGGNPPDSLRNRAVMAACRVAPDRARRHAPELVSWMAAEPEAFALLLKLKPCDRSLLDQLSLSLPKPDADATLTAAVILAHEPGNPKAQETLRRLATEGKPLARVEAAYWLCQLAEDAGPIVSNARAGLTSKDRDIRLKTAQRLEELGARVRNAGPILRAGLENSDIETRFATGRALQKIAPELMPPIRERD